MSDQVEQRKSKKRRGRRKGNNASKRKLRRRKIKLLMLLILTLIVIVFVAVFAMPRKDIFHGIYQSNGVSQDVKIIFKYKNGMRLTEKLNAELIIKNKEGQVVKEHGWKDWAFIAAQDGKLPFDYITMTYYSAEDDELHGHFYLDKNRKNMIIIADDFNVYASDDEFKQIIIDFLD